MNTSLEGVIDVIIDCFSSEQLKKLELTTVEGDVVSFKEQMSWTYSNKYPSGISIEEIKSRATQISKDFVDLLDEDCMDEIRDFLFYELEKGIFISKKSYLMNLDMEKDISECPKNTWNIKKEAIIKNIAVKIILTKINKNILKLLAIENEDKSTSFSNQLSLRYRWSFSKIPRFSLINAIGEVLNDLEFTFEQIESRGQAYDWERKFIISRIDSIFSKKNQIFFDTYFFDKAVVIMRIGKYIGSPDEYYVETYDPQAANEWLSRKIQSYRNFAYNYDNKIKSFVIKVEWTRKTTIVVGLCAGILVGVIVSVIHHFLK